jgi:serine/threonine protein kinase
MQLWENRVKLSPSKNRSSFARRNFARIVLLLQTLKESSTMSDRSGQTLGNYHLLHLLGRGGFADVYLGQHIHLGTLAAIKVLRVQLGNHDVEKFLHEAKIIAHLSHPHIVRVLDFGVEDGIPFLVMDHAPKGSLRELYTKGTLLPLTTIISYVKQVGDALQYAHEQKLIHRDVKPENMLLGKRNEVLLSDFGIAVIQHSTNSQVREEQTGTALYMAPEQIMGRPRVASDQYALVLSELKQHIGKAVTLLLCLYNKKRVEPGVLADELSLLYGYYDQEANKENQTRLYHVLLSSLSLHL